MTKATTEALAILGVLTFAIICTWILFRAVERKLQLPGVRSAFNAELTRSSSAPIDLVQLLDSMRSAVPVRAVVFMPTNKLYRARLEGREQIVGHSHETIAQLLRGVVWHELPTNCPTWTGDPFGGAGGSGCRCDVEEDRP